MDKPRAFKYIIGFNDLTQEADPLGVKKCKVKTEKQKEHIFFRRKLTGTMQFIGKDFEILKEIEGSAERCTELKVEIRKLCKDEYIPNWWKGYFGLNDVKWNHSKCTATVTPKPDDAYRSLLDNYGKPFNILEVAERTTVKTKLDLDASFEFYNTTGNELPEEDSDTWAVFLKGEYWIDGQGFQGGTRFNQDLHYRLIRTEAYVEGAALDLGFDGWAIVADDPIAKKAKYAKRPDLYNFKPYRWGTQGDFGKYPDLIQWPCGQAYDQAKYINVSAGIVNLASDCWNVRKYVNDDRPITLLWEFGSFSFTRNRKLLSVIEYLVQKTTGTPDLLPMKSDFFSVDQCYVTGTTNKLKDLLIAQKSDIIGFSSSEAARLGEVSLKSILEGIRQAFDCYWFINTEGKFQIEHAAYFEPSADVEMTEESNPLLYVNTNAYEYEKAEMPRFQRLKFTESSNPDFTEAAIEYSGTCVTHEEGADTEEELVSVFNNDIEQMLVSGEAMSKTGFVLIAHDAGEVRKDIGAYTGKLMLNACLSAANLLRDYHIYNRILITGEVNGEITTFKTVRKTKKQISLKRYICCDELDPYSRFITDVSANGSLHEMETNLSDGTAELVTLHEVSGSGEAQLGRQFDESFDMSFN